MRYCFGCGSTTHDTDEHLLLELRGELEEELEEEDELELEEEQDFLEEDDGW